MQQILFLLLWRMPGIWGEIGEWKPESLLKLWKDDSNFW